MSHVAKISTVITDLECLEAAAVACGLEFHNGQQKYRWFGRHVGDYPLPTGFKASDLGKCDHAISVPGKPRAYEVGVCKNPNGDGYVLLWDFWGRGYGLQDHVGNDCCKLLDAYNKEVTIKFAQSQGWSYTEEVNSETGETTLNLYDYSG